MSDPMDEGRWELSSSPPLHYLPFCARVLEVLKRRLVLKNQRDTYQALLKSFFAKSDCSSKPLDAQPGGLSVELS